MCINKVHVKLPDNRRPLLNLWGFTWREDTGSLLFSEVKPCWKGLKIGWVTILKYPALFPWGVEVTKWSSIRFFHQSHNTVLFGRLFTLKQWIISSPKHDTVPRVNKLYCFYVKNPPNRIALWDRENSQLCFPHLWSLCVGWVSVDLNLTSGFFTGSPVLSLIKKWLTWVQSW